MTLSFFGSCGSSKVGANQDFAPVIANLWTEMELTGMSTLPELMSPEEAAKVLKTSVRQLRDRARRDRMPCVRVTPHSLAFLKSDIEEILRKALDGRRWPEHWGPDPLESD